MRTTSIILLSSLAIPFLSFLYSRLSLFGVFRFHFHSIHTFINRYTDQELFLIKGIQQCEDIEYVPRLGKIYAACQGNTTARWGWWPAWNNLDNPVDGLNADGGLFVIDVKVSRPKASLIPKSFGPKYDADA